MNTWRVSLPALALLPLLAILGLAGAPAQAQQVNFDEIFRCVESDRVQPAHCDRARNTLINNCTTCHTFVPIVMQQFDDGGWRGLLDRHRVRVPHLSDAEIDEIQLYLAENFNENLPPPEVPPQLLENWTDY